MKQSKVVSINSNNPDYYVWGKNCQILGYDKDLTEKIFFAYEVASFPKESEENFDLFWEGYYSKN